MQLDRSLDQKRFVLANLRIGQAALDGANRLTRFVVVEADAFRAQLRIDHVDLVAFADCLVGALRLASAAVDAVFGNVGSHGVVCLSGMPSGVFRYLEVAAPAVNRAAEEE